MKIDTFRIVKVLLLGRHLYATTALRGVTIAMSGVLAGLWCALAGSRNGNVESLMPMILIVFVILGAVCGFFAVPALFQTSRWTSLLKLPCSPLERLAAIILNGLLSYTVIFTIPLAVALGAGWLLNLCFWGYSHAVFDPFSTILLSGYLIGLPTVSIGAFVALYRKPSYQILWGALLFVSMIFLPVYVLTLFHGSPVEPLLGTLAFRDELTTCLGTVLPGPKVVISLMSSTLALSWVVGLPLAAYFRLRESEA